MLKSENVSNRKNKVLDRVVGGMNVELGNGTNEVTDVVDIEMLGNIVKNGAEMSDLHAFQLEEDLVDARDELKKMACQWR
jgi:hypothetical protein